jgi:hypothetical protein
MSRMRNVAEEPEETAPVEPLRLPRADTGHPRVAPVYTFLDRPPPRRPIAEAWARLVSECVRQVGKVARVERDSKNRRRLDTALRSFLAYNPGVLRAGYRIRTRTEPDGSLLVWAVKRAKRG